MGAAQQGEEPAGEGGIVVWTAESASHTEFHEVETAVGTGGAGLSADELPDMGQDELLDDGVEVHFGRGADGEPSPGGARSAQVENTGFTVDGFSQVNDGRGVATLAGHFGLAR